MGFKFFGEIYFDRGKVGWRPLAKNESNKSFNKLNSTKLYVSEN